MWVKIDCLSSRYLAQEAVANTISSIKVSKKNFTNDVLVREHQLKCGISSNVDQHDIAIVGGGMVGIALACALYITFHCIESFLFLDFLTSIPLTRHLNVAIIDSNPTLGRIDGIKKGEPRVGGITPATVSIFKVGKRRPWKDMLEYGHNVWDYTGLGYTWYNAKDIGKEMLGCVVENKVIHSSLLSCLKVGADGGQSRVRESAGIQTTGWKYSQNAVICTVEHTAENQCAWQRFLPSGPIALLPVGDNFCNTVWTMSPAEAFDRKTMTVDNFVREVNKALDYGYGPHPQPGLLDKDEKFLIGDAAHTVHPLAGQGVNLGYGDAVALSRIIADGIALGTNIGELSLLKKFESERKSANLMMMGRAVVLHSIDLGPFNVLRAAALSAVQHISPLKRNIMSYATGEQKWPLFS
ncbi:hypothetical protein MKW92_021787 [Papaver armeniacum]|nr:hypothetical protein MKW92_021787 [Papaver armeniacum]